MSVGAKASGKLLIRQNIIIIGILSIKPKKKLCGFEFNRIKQCDVVLVNLKDINISIGTSDELLFSYLNGIPIVGFCEESDYIDLIHTWKIEQIDRIESGKDALQNALDYILNYYS